MTVHNDLDAPSPHPSTKRSATPRAAGRPRRRSAEILLVLGALLVSLALVQMIARSCSTHRDLDRLTELAGRNVLPGPDPADHTALPIPEPGELIGRVSIPAHSIDAPIRHGADERVLRSAAGHVPGTALPGSAIGNTVLSAHRDSLFRNLRHVRVGDRVLLDVLRPDQHGSSISYRVTSMEIVDEQALWVLDSKPQPELTLITCYPFDSLRPASQRYVVRAEPIDGLPPSEQRTPTTESALAEVRSTAGPARRNGARKPAPRNR